jgi:hypothetical protein
MDISIPALIPSSCCTRRKNNTDTAMHGEVRMLPPPLSLPFSQKSGREINWVYLIHEIIKPADLFSNQHSGEFSIHRLLHPTSWKPPHPSSPLISERLLHSPFHKSLNEPKTNPNLPPSLHFMLPHFICSTLYLVQPVGLLLIVLSYVTHW